MAVGKFLDPLKAVMAFLALVFVKWHGLPEKRIGRRSSVLSSCANDPFATLDSRD